MILYYQCTSGISGDMNLGALIDLGVPEEYLRNKLQLLKLEHTINIYKDDRQNIIGTKVDVFYEEHHHHHRNIKDIYEIIESSDLSKFVKELSKKIFYIVAESEAIVHDEDIEEVHFHEVGAVDSIIDIVGAAICFEYLKVDKIYTSTVELGGGFVKCAHGILPVPAPATIQILKDYKVSLNGADFESTTPTGGAIIKSVSSGVIDNMKLIIKNVGVGVGSKISSKPNILRVYLGEEEKGDTLLIECNIDDMNPEFYGSVIENLFKLGSKDSYITPIYMKKGRPGVILSSIVLQEDKEKIIDYILRNTTTFGLRINSLERVMLDRDFSTINTSFGEVILKNGYLNGEKIKSKIEYSSILKLSEENNLSPYNLYNKINREIGE